VSKVITIGLDIAKNVFHAHGADERGAMVFSRKLTRGKLLEFFAGQPPCTVALEACGGAHHWARQLQALGHDVRLIPPAYVKPFVKRNKNDAVDAEAICEAAQRPGMRFVAVKTEEQQAAGLVFRTRDLVVRQRTQLKNRIHATLAKYALTVSGVSALFGRRGAGRCCGSGLTALPPQTAYATAQLLDQVESLDRQVRLFERRLGSVLKATPEIELVMTLPGVGFILAAVIVLEVGDGARFADGEKPLAGQPPYPYVPEVRRRVSRDTYVGLQSAPHQEPDRDDGMTAHSIARSSSRTLHRVLWSLLSSDSASIAEMTA